MFSAGPGPKLLKIYKNNVTLSLYSGFGKMAGGSGGGVARSFR